jgi:YHS domain-containing protein
VKPDQTSPPAEIEFKTACGGRIKDPSNYPGSDYEGGQVYFCTHACMRIFHQDREAFMNGEVEHPIDEN